MKHSSKRERKTEHGKTINSLGLDPAQGFNFGYFYRSIEDHIVAYANQAGGENTFSDIAAQLSQLLEAASVRERVGGSQLVPQMRQDTKANMRGRSAGLHADVNGAAPDVHVRTRNPRTLSAEGRERIAEAQRKRWKTAEAKREYARAYYWRKKYKKKSARVKGGSAYEEQLAAVKRREHAAKGAKAYWYKMTPEERSAEISRRRKVTLDKKRRTLEGK